MGFQLQLSHYKHAMSKESKMSKIIDKLYYLVMIKKKKSDMMLRSAKHDDLVSYSCNLIGFVIYPGRIVYGVVDYEKYVCTAACLI